MVEEATSDAVEVATVGVQHIACVADGADDGGAVAFAVGAVIGTGVAGVVNEIGVGY